MTADEIRALFTRADGSYLCARWGRPLVPVVFGIDDASLPAIKGAIEAVVALAGHRMAEIDPELGANLMVFLARDWAELPQVPHLDRLLPDLGPLCDRLAAAGANQYRFFRFDPQGGIRAAFVLLRMDEHLSAVPLQTLALSQAVQTILLWSDRAFANRAPLAMTDRGITLRPAIGALIRAAYDPLLPLAAHDPSHALRLAARLARVQ